MMKVKLYLVLVGFLLSSTSLYAQKFDFTYNGVEFKCKLSNGSVTVTSFPVKAKRVVIPAKMSYHGKEYPVKSVDVFLNGVNYLAEELVLEEGIEDIAKFSFNEFRKLRSVTLPTTLKHIGRNAFRNNRNMNMYLASNIDEQALRSGKEFYPLPGGAPSTHQTLLAQTRQTPKVGREKQPEQMDPIKSKESLKPQPQILDEPETLVEKQPEQMNPIKSKESLEPQPQILDELETLVDVDVDIPTSTVKNSDTYCVIIANEDYDEVTMVEYAKRDGEIFKEYCLKTLGIPEKNIKMYPNATYTTIKRAINWMSTTANVTGGRSKMLLYYAGHGIPGEQDKMAYLLPTDGIPKDVETCYKLSTLYNRLGKINAQNVTVFLDACFSGMKRGQEQPLVAARGVAIKVKPEVLSGNVVVFSAASDDETAMAYQEKRHGMFTYFLLNKLKETKGKVSLGELVESVSSAVKKNSWLENEKLQTPSINVSRHMETKWKNIHL